MLESGQHLQKRVTPLGASGAAVPNHRLEKVVRSTHFFESQPNRPNDVICDRKKSGHRQEPAVTFARLKFMQEITEEDSCPVPGAFTNLKLTSNAALQTPAFARLV
jgi:hypothetical protein